MKILVKEIGAIKEATIDLSKKLSVFGGPNGTGKTYLAYVLYAITNEKNKSIGIPFPEDEKRTLLDKNEVEISLNLSEIWNFRQKEVVKIKQNLWTLFAVPESKATDFFKDTEIAIIDTEEDFINRITLSEIKFELNILDYSFSLRKNNESKKLQIILSSNTIKNKDLWQVVDIVLMSKIYSYIAFYPVTSSTIFPVERNSIYTFINELSVKKNEAYDQIQNLVNKKEFDLFDMFKRKTRYPQPIKDGLDVAEQLDIVQKRNSEFYKFAEEIEKNLLKGKVIITKDTNEVQFVSDRAKSRKLSFHQSSSIVKTLASLVIYLKHNAVKNDLIIIDEPELNLHPDNQILLTRIFAKLINNGLRLIVSTHSDYIIREFNNLVMLSNEKKELQELAKKYGYENDEKINPNDIGVYYFDFPTKTAKQLTVKQIEIDLSGFEFDSIGKAIDAQNEVSEELFYALKYAGEDE